MVPKIVLDVLIVLVFLACVNAQYLNPQARQTAICERIKQELPATTKVFYNGAPLCFTYLLGLMLAIATNPTEYQAGIYHWATSSTQISQCVVQPGSTAEVGKVVSITSPYLGPCSLAPLSCPAVDPWTNTYPVRRQRWRTLYKPWFLLHNRSTHFLERV